MGARIGQESVHTFDMATEHRFKERTAAVVRDLGWVALVSKECGLEIPLADVMCMQVHPRCCESVLSKRINDVAVPDPNPRLVFEKRAQDIVVTVVRGSDQWSVTVFVRGIQVDICITLWLI